MGTDSRVRRVLAHLIKPHLSAIAYNAAGYNIPGPLPRPLAALTIGGNSVVIDQNTQQTSELVWPHQAQVDALYTGGPGGLTLLRGFEYTSDQENHLNVIGSQNWLAPVASHFGDLTMAPFYLWLSTAPVTDPLGTGTGYGGNDGVGQFNHPDSKGALNFDDYAFNAAAAPYMKTIEIFGNQSYPGGLKQSDGGWYWFALSQGWTLGPTMDWDNHYWTDKIAQPNPGSSCGHDSFLPCERTLIFATENSKGAIMDALRAHRTGATQFPGLWTSLHTPDGTFMGSTIVAEPGQTISLIVDAGSDINPLTSGHNATRTIAVTVPTAASTRPDGAHFFYAVAHAADGSRAWSAPIFVASSAKAPALRPVRRATRF